jgi:hypothetical protein
VRVDVALPERPNGYASCVADVIYPASFVHCETFEVVKLAGERVRYERPVPFERRTVDEAPTEPSPVPPRPTARVPDQDGVNV